MFSLKSCASIAVAAYASLAIGSAAQAAVVVYELPYIATWDEYLQEDTSLTVSGTGYVGMYEGRFGALFGLEGIDYTRTHAQVGIGGLAGASISSAVLSFDILEGGPRAQSVRITGYSGTGALGYQWDAPGVNYGAEIFDVVFGSNALDITTLLTASVEAGDDWLNLHLQGLIDPAGLWTYAVESDDRANVRLTVTYDVGQSSAVPAPAPLGLLLVGLAGMGILRHRSS